MKVLVWLAEASWPACLDAALGLFADAELRLVAVADPELAQEVAGRSAGLWGRQRDTSGRRLGELAARAAAGLVERAQERVGRSVDGAVLTGRTERVVTEAAASADVLVLARDGDLSRLGPRSLGRHTRFVVDHAPCRVLLVWPGHTPSLGSIPPAPQRTGRVNSVSRGRPRPGRRGR